MTQSLYDSLPVVLHHVGIEELVVGCPAADGLLVVFSRGNIPGNWNVPSFTCTANEGPVRIQYKCLIWHLIRSQTK
jgi:hypothetical protein